MDSRYALTVQCKNMFQIVKNSEKNFCAEMSRPTSIISPPPRKSPKIHLPQPPLPQGGKCNHIFGVWLYNLPTVHSMKKMCRNKKSFTLYYPLHVWGSRINGYKKKSKTQQARSVLGGSKIFIHDISIYLRHSICPFLWQNKKIIRIKVIDDLMQIIFCC